MSYDVNKAAVNFENQLKSYQRNESAAFAEFKAQEAFKQFQVQNAEKAADEEAKNLF